MAKCVECNSKRIVTVNAKCSDTCDFRMGNKEITGEVPADMNIGEGDYINFDFCLECGLIQGDFPVDETQLEQADSY